MKNKLITIRPVWLLVLVASATGLLVYALGEYQAPDLIKYFTYLYSTFVLIVLCANLPRTMRYALRKTKCSRIYRKIKALLFHFRPIRQYFTDLKLKHQVDLSISTMTNFAFNIFRLGDGVMRGAVWEISLAVYYLFLVMLKTTLLWNFRYFDKEGEKKIYRRSGVLLLGLGLLLMGMITQMVLRPTGKSYSGNLMIYLVAMYSFYLIISATVGMVKYRKSKSPTLKVIKCINLITASVSLLMLQTIMLTTFGGDMLMTAKMNGISGAAAVVLILVISIYILKKGFGERKR